MNEYTTESIVLLDGIAAIRKRPGMYVGDTSDGTGMRQVLWELVGNGVDEHLAGRASRVRISIEDRVVTVEDDGPGIPIDAVPGTGKTALEIVFSELRASGGDKHPHVHIGESLRGLGCVIANALSKSLEVETIRAGRRYRMTFARGRALTSLVDLGETDRVGTRVRFEPDPQIFPAVHWDLPMIHERLWDVACLNPALALVLNGESMRAPEGLVSWIRARSSAPPLHPTIHLHGEHEGIAVEVAMHWVDGDGIITAWASQFRTMEGSHVRGFWAGLHEALAPELSPEAARECLQPGLVAAIHADIEDPRYGSPTRDRLETPEAATAVTDLLRTGLRELPPAVAALIRRRVSR